MLLFCNAVLLFCNMVLTSLLQLVARPQRLENAFLAKGYIAIAGARARSGYVFLC